MSRAVRFAPDQLERYRALAEAFEMTPNQLIRFCLDRVEPTDVLNLTARLPDDRSKPKRSAVPSKVTSVELTAGQAERLDRLVEATGVKRNTLLRVLVLTLTPDDLKRLAGRR